MNLSGNDVEDALFCVNVLIGYMKRAGDPIAPWILELGRRFNTKSLISEMSAGGHDFETDEQDSEVPVLVGPREAAEKLGISTRQLRRLAADLDSQMISGRRVYNLQTVEKYAEEKRNGRAS